MNPLHGATIILDSQARSQLEFTRGAQLIYIIHISI